MKKETIKLEVVNHNAAGIDIGSASHYVAVGQNLSDVKEFGISHSDHLKLIVFLKERQVRTIAMESTGSYWQSLFLVLSEEGFDLLLVPGSQVKSFRKTDVKDARHIQQLHALGLLNSCFLPDDFTIKVRELARHRKSLIEDSSRYINRMQKCLRLMNLRLDVVINDIVGVSGKAIIESILAGERDPKVLASLANGRVKKTKEQIADALHGNFKPELMYELRDNWDLYNFIQQKIQKTDDEISQMLESSTEHIPFDKNIQLAKKQLKGKNQPRFEIQKLSYKLFGVDLSAIAGVSVNTLLSFVSEVGTSLGKFENSKAFVSWLRLTPNNKVSGNKVISSKTPKGKSILARAFRDAANVIGNQKNGHLTNFFKKIGLRKGRGAAITATARKLATIMYNMVTKKIEYNPILPSHIQEKIKEKTIRKAKEIMAKHGFIVIDNQGVVA
jgi:transposase